MRNAVWPRPVSLSYTEKEAVAVYDIRGFLERANAAGRKPKPKLFLHNANARDFGFEWIRVLEGKGVGPDKKSQIFNQSVKMKAYIHAGRSCGYPEGCNNGSPFEPDLYFKITDLPAEVLLGLWKSEPGPDTPPDFRFRIKLN